MLRYVIIGAFVCICLVLVYFVTYYYDRVWLRDREFCTHWLW